MRSFDRSAIARVLSWPLAVAAYPFYRARYRFRGNPADGVSHMAEGPQWGKNSGGNDGPPDLDEILRKFNQKLGNLFGSKGPGNNAPSEPGGGMSGNVIGSGVALACGLAVSIWLATGFYIVEQGSKGIELRLGKYTQTTEAGPRWHWPYPIETAEVVNVQAVRALEVGHRNNQKTKMREEALMLTEDQNIVDVQFAVQYTLSSPEEYKFNNRDPDEAVRQVAETAMREVVGKSKMDFVLYEGRGDIAARVKALMQQILNRYKTGILVMTVNLQNAQPPEQVQASFDDAVRAKQDRERLKNEGEAYANDILPRARGAAARLMEEANGYKQRVIANAQGDASRFSQVLTEYEKAPGVTRERLYLDMMQQVMQSTSKVVVDQKGGNSLLYLPLDKLIQAATVAAPPATPMPVETVPRVTTTAESATPAAEARRDLRNR
jgi:membrane protease subunit HflK